MIAIGIDVGGTNTDAVLLDGHDVIAACKTASTQNVTDGICRALDGVIAGSASQSSAAVGMTIGTTHFVNAVVQRKGLNRVAALRLSLPACASLPPFVDWPGDLRQAVHGGVYLARGGFEFDGRLIAPLDELAIANAARQIRQDGVTAVAITGVFSALNEVQEQRAAEIVQAEHPDARITRSSDVGRIGLLERENATLLNAALLDLAEATASGFEAARAASGLKARVLITQNDGTVAPVDRAKRFPVFSFASGPTTSMRGAAFLSGVAAAAVCDVGGTTTDIGYLRKGFPREANNVITIGGVRTLFRMPDVLSVALGGGTRIYATQQGPRIGPESVGHRLEGESRVFGGNTLTCTDIAVAAGLAESGDPERVDVSSALVEASMRVIHDRIAHSVDRMKTDAREVPLIAVGGGAMLVPETIPGFAEVLRVPHHDVANAVGAAIAEVSGETDRVYRDVPREEAIDDARGLAARKAVEAGAASSDLRTVEVEDFPLAYLPGNALRVRVRVVGPLGDGTNVAG